RCRRSSTEHIRQDACDLAGVTIFHAIDLDAIARSIGAIEPADPGRGDAQHRRLAADHHNGIKPADYLEFDDALAEAAFAGIHDLFEFGDDRLWRTVTDWENADRLAAHKVDVKTHDGFDGGLSLRSSPLNQQQIARGVGANAARLGRKRIQ